jgi:uncharacterized protein YdeI (YjbR/CyaY-like superfamily)
MREPQPLAPTPAQFQIQAFTFSDGGRVARRDPRVDAYIANAADFAKPILEHIRAIVHEACPEVEETTKWSVPHFDYKGMMCGMAAFKQHCTFGFWKGSLVLGGDKRDVDGMGQFGKLQRVSDLPPKKVLVGYIKKAMQLNDEGIKPARAARVPKPELPVPGYLSTALGRNRKAKATFDGFSPSHRREYIEWITEAKSEATREKRLETALEWMAEGKPRNWKYQR